MEDVNMNPKPVPTGEDAPPASGIDTPPPPPAAQTIDTPPDDSPPETDG